VVAAALAAAGTLAAWQRRGTAPGPEDGGQTPAVFRRFAAQVPKLQVVEVRSGAKEVTGSAFYVAADGLAITNYHVVSDLVRDPDKYRAELLADGRTTPVRVLAVDVVHDLAVIRTGAIPPGWFRLAPVSIAQGLRLYALGHPGDLGIAIVEGTFNGRLPHTLYPRIHFTGSINPGMSGGPTITLDGRVVGINVATAGNQQSFLVPVDDAIALLAQARRAEPPPEDSLMAEVGRQLLAYQDVYLARLFADSVPTVRLGGWVLPTEPTDVFNCWGETDEDVDQPYTITHHYCSTGDDVFLSSDQSSGIIEFEHDLIESDDLGPVRFAALYTRELRSLASAWGLDRKGDEDVTGDRCRASNVRQGRLRGKAILCLRAYKRLPGLYDAVFRLATLGGDRSGVITTLTLSGVSFANAERVVRRYVGTIGWAP